MALLVVAIVQFFNIDTNFGSSKYLAHVESPSEEMGAFSFSSQSDNVFVIWLYDRPPEFQREMSYVNDIVIQ